MTRPHRYGLLFLSLLSSLTSCSSEGDTSTSGAAGATKPLYAMMVQVYGPDDRTVYLALSGSLDVDAVPLTDAREFPGVANFAVVGGRLLVSDGTAPSITEFEVDDSQTWREKRSVSFADYPLVDNANFYGQFLVDEHTAMLSYDVTKRVVWDPSEMAITGTLEDSMLVSKEPTLMLEAGGNRNSVQFKQGVIQAFYYHDDDWFDYGSQSHAVVYDLATRREARVLDIPCPALSLATRDEQGDIYFATWDLPAASVSGDKPPTCVARVGADGTLRETLDLRTWTGGRFVNNFRYVGNGKAFANVLHHEALGVATPDQLDAASLETLWKSGPHWRLWSFDLIAKTAAPVEGVDVAVGSGAQFAVLDGRTFVFVPYDEWSRTKIYELGADGTAVPRLDVVGDVFKWVRVR